MRTKWQEARIPVDALASYTMHASAAQSGHHRLVVLSAPSVTKRRCDGGVVIGGAKPSPRLPDRRPKRDLVLYVGAQVVVLRNDATARYVYNPLGVVVGLNDGSGD